MKLFDFSKKRELKKQKQAIYEAIKALVDEANSEPNEEPETVLIENQEPKAVLRIVHLNKNVE